MDLAHLHMFLSPLASVGLVMYLSVADPDLTHVWATFRTRGRATVLFGGCLSATGMLERARERASERERKRERVIFWMDGRYCVEKPKRPALPVGLGRMPCPVSFIPVITRQRDPRNVCNAWKIHPFFSGDIIDALSWALQLNASECDESIYENMFYSFCVICHAEGQWWGLGPCKGPRQARGHSKLPACDA